MNQKEKNNSNYKHGKYCKSKKYYCIDCGKEISPLAIRCKKCHNINIGKNKKSKVKNYRRNPTCIDCGKILKSKYAQRCSSCSMKYIRKYKFWSVNKNKKMAEEQKRKISKTRIERGVAVKSKNPYYKKGKPKCIDCGKQLTNYKTKRCIICQNKLRVKLSSKKNNCEKIIEKLLNEILPEQYKYVGQGNFWVERFNPDFININGQKKIIEHYGDYWHNREDALKRDKKRLKIYKEYGYKTLIIWQHELNDLKKVKKRILNFNKVRSKV